MDITQSIEITQSIFLQPEAWFNHPWLVGLFCGLLTGLVSGYLVWSLTTKKPSEKRQIQCQKLLKAQLSLFRFSMRLITNNEICSNGDSQFLRRMFAGNWQDGRTYEEYVTDIFERDSLFRTRFTNDTNHFVEAMILIASTCLATANVDAFMEISKLRYWMIPDSKNFVGMVFDILTGQSRFLWGINIDRCIDEFFSQKKLLKDYELTSKQPKENNNDKQ